MEVTALKPFLTSIELRKLLGITASTLWRWRNSRNFPKGIKITKTKVIFKTQEVLNWLENREE